jgi:hypothetical protein
MTRPARSRSTRKVAGGHSEPNGLPAETLPLTSNVQDQTLRLKSSHPQHPNIVDLPPVKYGKVFAIIGYHGTPR